MAKHIVGRAADLAEGERLIVNIGERSIGVFNVGGKLFAVLNQCPHKGAELCRGSLVNRFEANGPGQVDWTDGQLLIQCPWHGWEYDLETGKSYTSSAVRAYPVGVMEGADAGEDCLDSSVSTAVRAAGRSGPRLTEGPFTADTFPVEVEDEYIVITLPGGQTSGAGTANQAEKMNVAVVGRRQVSSEVVELTFERPSSEDFPEWTAGAHIDLDLKGLGSSRQYSLCGQLDDRSQWVVAVKLEEEGRGGSSWIHEHLTVGNEIQITGPRNGFELVEASSYTFIAGGIGITPIRAMVQAAEAANAEWTLDYGGRSSETMAFAEELKQLYGDRVRVRPEDEAGFMPLESIVAEAAKSSQIYCCGPEPLLEAIESICAELEDPSRLRMERFAAKPGALDGESRPFQVVAARSGVTLTVDSDQSIVEALAAEGISVPTSCCEGVCGTCETGVLDGEVDHRDSFLSDSERKTGGTMMVCCSRAAGDRLVLDL